MPFSLDLSVLPPKQKFSAFQDNDEISIFKILFHYNLPPFVNLTIKTMPYVRNFLLQIWQKVRLITWHGRFKPYYYHYIPERNPGMICNKILESFFGISISNLETNFISQSNIIIAFIWSIKYIIFSGKYRIRFNTAPLLNKPPSPQLSC